MMSSLYVSATGMKTQSYGMQIVGNNLANVNTIAYKQQDWLFQDLMYKDLALGTSNTTIKNQAGAGSMECITRTLFTQGAQESTDNFTDLSINGTGFFKVQSESGEEYLTRAGDFIFTKEGFLQDPTGATVMAYPIDFETGEEGGLQPFQLDMVHNAPISPFMETTQVSGQLNLGFSDNAVQSYEMVTIPDPNDPTQTIQVSQETNPYFSLLESYDASSSPIMPENIPYSQPMTVYDSNGNKQEITFHFDTATEDNGQRTVEFIATVPPGEALNTSGTKDGVLMAGTMTFSSAGQLINMSAFTPTGDASDLNNWTAAPLNEEGEPMLTVQFDGTEEAKQIAINFGAASTSGWSDSSATAASVGSDISKLPTIGVPPELEAYATTNYPLSTSSITNYVQDGAPQGELASIYFSSDGTAVGNFTNGKSADLYRIPVYRVTSQDGLRNEGNNHYTTTRESGLEEEGIAGTENYGYITGSAIETSNVSMEQEMTELIILQRGFQSISKAITTSDEMLSKAVDLKRT